jgi:hypothetical protein
MPNASPFVLFILFADDTNIFYSHGSLITLYYKVMNIELTKLADWFRVNKLTLNLEKLII